MEHAESPYVLLARLAWNLAGHGLYSTMSAGRDAAPHVTVSLDRSRWDVARVVREGKQWHLVWRGTKLDAADVPPRRAQARRGHARMTGEMTVLGEITLPGVERSAGDAREFLRDTLGPDHPALADLCVCVCELLTNGLRHTKSGQGGRVTIRLAQAASAVRIEVTDDGAGGARPRLRKPDAESGRGLHIVEALAVRWGYVPIGERTTVWVELAVGRLD